MNRYILLDLNDHYTKLHILEMLLEMSLKHETEMIRVKGSKKSRMRQRIKSQNRNRFGKFRAIS